MKIFKYAGKIIKVTPRVIILLPFYMFIKLGEAAEKVYDIVDPYLPGWNR